MIALRTVALLGSLALVGCQDPYARDHSEARREPPRPTAAAPTDTEHPGPRADQLPRPEVGVRNSSSARATARRFASRWVNWDWQTAASQQRALAELATGDLARQLRANAQSARIDATLARDKPGSRGTVAAIRLTISSGHAAGLVVAREQMLTDGHAELGGRRYRVYTVRLVRAREHWGVSAWTPQP